jgi:hypothetical protein
MVAQASCPIFVVWLATLEEAISHSVYFDIHIHFICSRCRISLLPLVFISFRIIIIQLTSGYSKLAIEFDR